MPLEPAASNLRRWVAVYTEGAASTRVRNDDPPPSYEEVMGATPSATQRLPPSRAVPLAMANEPLAWRLRLSTPLHPQAQTRTLQKQLERRERTQRKLEAAYNHLDRVLRRHETLSASGRAYCGGGLLDDDECSAISHARHEVTHYLEKKRELQDAHAALLRRSPAPLSPG